MKNLTWQNPEQLFVAQELINKVKSKCCGIKDKIKALTNYSPSEFIRKVRMNEAAILLKSKKYTVSEVSDMLGFGDPKYFTDSFKKYFDVPPSVYMKQN